MKEKLHPHNGVPRRTYWFFYNETERLTLKGAKKLKKMELFYKLCTARAHFSKLRGRMGKLLLENGFLKRRIRQLEKGGKNGNG